MRKTSSPAIIKMVIHSVVSQFRDSALRGSGGGFQNFSTVLQSIFNSDQPILPAPVTDSEAMARVPAASVIADSVVLQNYTLVTTTTTTPEAVAVAVAANRSLFGDAEPISEPWLDTMLQVLKLSVMVSIMVAAIFGNLLVIASVMRHRKLRFVSFSGNALSTYEEMILYHRLLRPTPFVSVIISQSSSRRRHGTTTTRHETTTGSLMSHLGPFNAL